MGNTISTSYLWGTDSESAQVADATAAEVADDDPDLGALLFPIQLLTETAKTPTRATEGAAGYDIYASEETTIAIGTRALVGTGVALAMDTETMPPNTSIEACVRGRSGLAKKGIDVFCGTIDSDYRGEVKVLVINNSHADHKIEVGDRIAQLVFGIVLTPALVSHADVKAEFATTRGESGFGSTGVSVVEEAPEGGDAMTPAESV